MDNNVHLYDGNIRPINSGDPDCSGNLFDYYIKTLKI